MEDVRVAVDDHFSVGTTLFLPTGNSSRPHRPPPVPYLNGQQVSPVCVCGRRRPRSSLYSITALIHQEACRSFPRDCVVHVASDVTPASEVSNKRNVRWTGLCLIMPNMEAKEKRGVGVERHMYTLLPKPY
jgi:hypothetical protein